MMPRILLLHDPSLSSYLHDMLPTRERS